MGVYRRANDAQTLGATLDVAATLTSAVLPGFAALVARLFPA